MNTRRNCYEILGVDRRASGERIRRAYRSLSALYEPGNPTLYGLYDEVDAQAILAEIRHAYRVLMDPTARNEHDRMIFPAPMTAEMSVDEDSPDDDFPVPDMHPDEPTTALMLSIDAEAGPGMRFRSAREAMGLQIDDIAERTKIPSFTLQCLESEGYGDLPPLIYVKGFLNQVSSLLRLDDDSVVDEYIRRYSAYLKSRDR